MGMEQTEQQKQQKIESFMDTVDDVKKEVDHEFISNLITQHFSQRLFVCVSDFQTKKTDEELNDDVIDLNEEPEYDDEEVPEDMLEEYWEDDPNLMAPAKRGKDQRAQDAHVRARIRREKEKKLREIKRWEFPSKIGSHHNYVSPALEFSKFICTHIFGLDEAFHLEAHNVKMNLLRMIHCKEFSPEAQEGVEPSLILVVPDVICDYCQKCEDLDICRDPSLNEDLEESGGSWTCGCCEHELNKFTIERRLLDLANRRLVSYQLQDLKCKQCKMVRNSCVAKYCECTGAYLQTIGHIEPEKLKN